MIGRTGIPDTPIRMRPTLLSLQALWLAGTTLAATYSWQQPHAKVVPTGDLEWTPQPFVFEKGASVRHIDFASGDDTNPGTQAKPWKHHPWDPNATANAQAGSGIHTYVFKGGVAYRGTLNTRDSGEAGNPIRLTSDPNWGQGPAVLCGSELVTRWQRGATQPDIPNADKVWYADLDFTPRNVWSVATDGTVTRLTLARTPNWKVTDPDDIKSEWWAWDNPKNAWGQLTTNNGRALHLGVDTVHLTNTPAYYQGAYVWPEYGWVMGTPYPTRVQAFFPEQRALAFGGQWGDTADSYHMPRHARYFLEDKPHYLDEAGEFWFDRKNKGGRLYLRLPGDADPNTARVEAARHLSLIESTNLQHVQISGLTFRFVNTYWNLDAPPTQHRDVDPACIRLLGSGSDIVIANCVFEHVHMPVRLKSTGEASVVDRVVIRDNDIRWTDHGAIWLQDGGEWGKDYHTARLLDVQVLRNRLYQIGLRPTRYGQGHAIEVDCAETAEVAGNILDRLYGSGIFVYGGKRSGSKVDRPLSRILIHHNKVTDSLLNNNDWGGIETWQGGPAYVFDNISGNPGGFKKWGLLLHAGKPTNARFGHAYYMDGGYKQYYFNNIAWGKSNDPLGPLGNTAAFQEIYGYLTSIFNNTIYNFVVGSRRQAPDSGRNKYLGNIWQDMGHMVFRHADPKDVMADPNAADAGAQKSSFEHESNAYANNMFSGVPERFAVFEPSGRWYPGLDPFRKALAARGSIGQVGDIAAASLLRAPAQHDFRPTAAAADRGVKVFVPWALSAVVGEWTFHHVGNDPALIPDEHFYLAPHYTDRTSYLRQPVYPLRATNVTAADYIEGPLEDWTPGALKFNGRNQYAVWSSGGTVTRTSTKAVAAPKNTPSDWLKIEAPEQLVPEQTFTAKLTLLQDQPGMKLRADLHWVRNNGKFGGMNAYGGNAQPATAGLHSLRFTPKAKPDLGTYVLTVWLSPTGNFDDNTKITRHTIPASAADGAETSDSFPSPQVQQSSFLIETYFRTEPGHTGGVLAEKCDSTGYGLMITAEGRARFTLKAANKEQHLDTTAKLNDGNWHHLIAEADRKAGTLALYVDGRADATGTGFGPGPSLANASDLQVGGTRSGRCLAGTMEFLRIALGTLTDAKTTIEELYAWEFTGPSGRDFCGQTPTGKRDAGALEGKP